MMRRARWAAWSLVWLAACGDDAVDGAGGGPGSGGAGPSSTSTSVVQATSTTGSGLPATFVVTGLVTDGTAPVAGATVMQAGGEPAAVTGTDGTFEIGLSLAVPGEPTVVAAKVGYRTAGLSFDAVPTEPVELVLIEARAPDNAAGYQFGPPGVGDAVEDDSTAYCGHCHTTLTAQFQGSAHARSARDPRVQDLYAGAAAARDTAQSCQAAGGVWRAGTVPGAPGSAAPRCYVGAGVLPDLNGCGGPSEPACDDPSLPVDERPAAFGACADCHAIGMDGPAGGRDLLEATGIGFDFGNHCDACHHVADVDLSAPPGTGGRLRMQRPRERVSEEIGAPLRQVMFGPYPDVPLAFMGGSWQPQFATAELCGGCHQQAQPALLPDATLDARWPSGLPTHTTYEEWSESSWNTPGTPCQFCHMPPIEGLFNSVDVSTEENASIAFGFGRPAERIRAHTFRGPLEGAPRLLDGALVLGVGATPTLDELDVSVSVTNVGCGHAIPTGEPMRALVLVVEVDGCGATFEATGGLTIGDVGDALATGTIDGDATLTGTTLTWGAASLASVGQVVRVVRPSGTFDDYAGVGWFADPGRTPAEKGIEILEPVGEATVVAIGAQSLELDLALVVAPGDLVWLGDPLPASFADGAPSRALAGAAGHTFSKVLVDPDGARRVPHHRGVSIASDNRIPPQGEAVTSHRFRIPDGCDEATVRATVLYRPHPADLSRERGWEARDHVVASTEETFTL